MTKSGTRRKTARQVTLSASHPAMKGPTREGTTQAAASTENALGRSSTAYERAMSTYSETMTMPPPRPCSARPATRTGRAGASPATTAPTLKADTPATSGPRGPDASDHMPPDTIPNNEATR